MGFKPQCVLEFRMEWIGNNFLNWATFSRLTFGFQWVECWSFEVSSGCPLETTKVRHSGKFKSDIVSNII